MDFSIAPIKAVVMNDRLVSHYFNHNVIQKQSFSTFSINGWMACLYIAVKKRFTLHTVYAKWFKTNTVSNNISKMSKRLSLGCESFFTNGPNSDKVVINMCCLFSDFL